MTSFKDPICGMNVKEDSPYKIEYKGEKIYFCSKHCVEKFRSDPDKFLETKEVTISIDDNTQGVNTIFTCPMHPEVKQQGPASCPKCGMALEPIEPVLAEEDDSEYKLMSIRFWICLFLSIPVFIMAMFIDMFSSLRPEWLTQENIQWIEFLLSSPVVLWGGYPFFKKGYLSIKFRNLNMFTLISIGISVAWLYSVIGLLAPSLFPVGVRTPEGLVHVYFEAAAIITTLVILGQILELKARARTNSAIKLLLNLAPNIAKRIASDGTEADVAVEEIEVGDLLRIRPGEKMPVDGIVVEGESYIDESMITGEPVPVFKKTKDKVIAGTVNAKGGLVIQAKKVGKETLLSKIIEMVAEAQRSKAPIQKLADKVSRYFVPAVIISSLVAFVCWLLLGPDPRFANAMVNAVAVLIIACPCALGLATPIAIMVSMGRGATAGILIKNAEAIEELQKVNTLVVDKTGTLTEGKPVVTGIYPSDNFTKEALINITAQVEKLSEHPIGGAIINEAKKRGDSHSYSISDFQSITGKGVKAIVDSKEVIIGKMNFLLEFNINPSDDVKNKIESLSRDGNTVISIGIDKTFEGYICISDPIKKTSFEAVNELKKANIDIVMLTGDNKFTAESIASKLGIEKIFAGVLPDEKNNIIKDLKQAGKIVAMAGDGINDAPALATANVGIAMGTGTDVAMESADVTLIKGDLRGVIRAIKISKATMTNIKQNLFFAFFYNSAGVPIAAGILYPFFGILLSPIIAAMAMSFSSVSVITNSLRLKSIKL